ncbi:MAG: UDP-N-acetylmuramoylalanine--D-glutamate ligase [Bryobacterales bacterium]|nr:UDP-N-acetylmuramoylalanine--D-glutamate ligase [Bryobacterales bacterium]
MDLRGKDVLVVGAKRSGMSAAELLVRQGARVRAMDAQAVSPEERARFDSLGVPVLLQSPENFGDPDLVVLSPGVPLDLPLLESARRVIGEVELASYFLQGPTIGITGSNGKTTTTALTGHLLKEGGIPYQVGGNIGTAVTSLVESSRPEQWNVLELSSFQLESIEHFRAKIGVCLNVTPDHLDRHHTFEAYAAAKGKLFSKLGAGDFAVLNFDDPTCRSYAELSDATVLWFSTNCRVPHGLWLQNDEIWFDDLPFMLRSMIRLRGVHNVENAMAAALIANLAGAQPEQIASAIMNFPGVEHRIEFVRELDGVEYFNDSKATNVDATLKAIHAFPGNLWIILGGKDKGSDYAPLREPLHNKAKGALLIGAEPPYPYAAAPLIQKALEGAVPMAECGSLEVAVQHARSNAQAGDTVLLAPACASFDQFQSYEHRGRHFKKLVEELL